MSALAPPALPSSATRKFRIVLYPDRFGKKPICIETTLDNAVQLLTVFIEESPCTVAPGPRQCVGAKCPYKSHSSIPDNPMAWSPVEIEGKRLDRNVRALTLLVLDYDHIARAQFEFILAALAGREVVYHTTHNHRGDDDMCVRIVLALSRPVLADQWHRFLRAAIDYLRVSVVTSDKRGKSLQQPDPVCKDRGRMYFRPSHPSDAPHEARHVRGRVLDVDAVLAHADAMPPPPSPGRSRESRFLPEAVDWDLDGAAVADAIDCIARYFPDGQRHEFALALGGMLRAHGATEEDAHYIIFESFLAGGSDDPDTRAKTTEHTYALDEDAAMTGFTRVADIIGEAEARELGDYFARARNEEFLRELQRVDGYAVELPGSPPALGQPPPLPPPLPAPSVALSEVRAAISALASRRGRGDERDDQILAVQIRRLLDDRWLASPGGWGDVETVLDGRQRGMGRDETVRRVFGAIAFALPQIAPWHPQAERALWTAVGEIARFSLAATPADAGDDWVALARRVFEDARVRKARGEAERQRDEIERQARVRSAIEAQSPPSLPVLVGTVVDDDDELDVVEVHSGNWEDDLSKLPNGSLQQTAHNARMLLTHHSDFRGHIRWNEVAKRVEVTGGALKQYSRYGTESVVIGAADYLSNMHGLNVDDKKLGKRLVAVAMANPFDPIRNYLASLQWDGRGRMDTWLTAYCGAREDAENREFLRKVGRRWLVALVARGIKVATSASPSGPGCKVDNVLVMEGEGALGKSSVFEILGGEWFCDTAISLGDKDSRMMASQYWICELAEIVAFKHTGHDQLKSFFSSRNDKFRLPYGAEIQESPRRCLFVGTTNEDYYLGDETGNRKYWTVYCVYVAAALAALRRDRDQLLAEAVSALRAGEKWWFDYDEVALTEEQAGQRVIETPISVKVSTWWYGLAKDTRPTSLTTMDVAEAALMAMPMQVKKSDLQSIGHALKKMRFRIARDSVGNRQRRYYATDALLGAERVEPRRHGLFAISGGKKTDDDKK